MKLISVICELICPAMARQRNHILIQQQLLGKFTAQKNELEAIEKKLSKELQCIYSIIIHRHGCRLRLFPILQQESLLLAVAHNISQVNFYLYKPNQQSDEIAQAYTNVQDDALVIHEFYVTPTHCNTQIHSFLLQQIKMEAKALGLSVIYAYQANAI
jgi:hypothetical protein